MERADYRFSRRTVREHTRWGNTQLKVHLQRLEEMEYLLVHRGGRGQSFVYELVYHGEGKDGALFLPGLLDEEKLKESSGYDPEKSVKTEHRSGSGSQKSGGGRGQVGPQSVGGREEGTVTTAERNNEIYASGERLPPKTYKGKKANGPSYPHVDRTESLSPLAASSGLPDPGGS